MEREKCPGRERKNEFIEKKNTITITIVQIHCQQGTYADVDGEGTHPMPRDRPRQRGQWGKKKKNQAAKWSIKSATNLLLNPISLISWKN